MEDLNFFVRAPTIVLAVIQQFPDPEFPPEMDFLYTRPTTSRNTRSPVSTKNRFQQFSWQSSNSGLSEISAAVFGLCDEKNKNRWASQRGVTDKKKDTFCS